MAGDENGSSSSSTILASVACVLLLVATYALSIGPVAYFLNGTPTRTPAHRAADVVYAPIVLLYEESDAARDVIGWYCDLWRG